jgi:hypothetical protein
MQSAPPQKTLCLPSQSKGIRCAPLERDHLADGHVNLDREKLAEAPRLLEQSSLRYVAGRGRF